MGEREGLIRRVKQMRRAAAVRENKSTAEPAHPDPAADLPHPDSAAHGALEARITHLEELLEGLQDSVHRESERQSKRIADLEARTEPDALAVALSVQARERGL